MNDQQMRDLMRKVIDEVSARDIPAAPRIAPKAFAMQCLQEFMQQRFGDIWRCNICGGEVGFADVQKPTIWPGPGRPSTSTLKE